MSTPTVGPGEHQREANQDHRGDQRSQPTRPTRTAAQVPSTRGLWCGAVDRRRLIEKTSARSLIEYWPLACMRRSSTCCLGDSLGDRPRSRPLARAMAMPSRVRSRSRSTSNSASVARMLKRHFAHRVSRVVGKLCCLRPGSGQAMGNTSKMG